MIKLKHIILPALILLFSVSCGKTVSGEFNPIFGELPAGSIKTFQVLNEEGMQEYYYTETLGKAETTPEGLSLIHI